MPTIRYQSCFHAEVIEPNMVFLFSEKDLRLLRGKLHHLLAPFLREGRYTADEIVDALEGQASATEIYYALERLEKAGLVETKEGEFPLPFTAFCQIFGVSPKQAELKLKAASVFIQTIGKIKKSEIQKALQELKIRITTKKERASLVLLLTDDYLNVDLAPLQKKLFQEKRPFLMAKPIGCELWAGPLFIPNETGCGHCLTSRLRRNRIEESYVQRMKERVSHLPISIGGLASTKALSTNWIATEVFKCLVQPENSPLKGKILSFDLPRSQLVEHQLVKLPQCALCGEKTRIKSLPPPPMLQSRLKGIYNDNGWRCIAPEATLKKHAHQVSPILGVVKFLEAYEQKKGSSLYLYVAGHNFALSNSFRGIYRKSFRSCSGGKGRTDTQAKASALSEAIERYCGLFQGDERRVQGSYSTMKERGAIDLRECLQYSKKQYAEREKYNKSSMCLHETPYPFSEDEKIDWTPIWSLTERRFKYLPTTFCYYGYPHPKKRAICHADSNGNAAGNCLEEAILQGFFELVERDAVAIWWYNRLKRPSVDIHSFNDPYLPQLLAEYKEMNREVWVLDLTTDLNIPVFVALSRNMSGKSEEIYMGFGAHLNPQIAMIRALTEMNQFLSMDRFWDKEDELDDGDKKIMCEWFKTATVQNQPHLRGEKSRSAKDYPQNDTNDLLEDIHFCQKIVEEKGMELLVLDQTRPDIDLKVVKVVVPGLRHFWPRFAPGRLYDVPVAMGSLKKPRKEEELNPFPMFL